MSPCICLTLQDVFCTPSVRRCISSTPMLWHWPSFLPLCCVIKCCSDIYSRHADICIPSLLFPSDWLRLVFLINLIICAVIFVKPTALSERLLFSAVVSYTNPCTAACNRGATIIRRSFTFVARKQHFATWFTQISFLGYLIRPSLTIKMLKALHLWIHLWLNRELEIDQLLLLGVT